ncbi:MAG: outer membrane protein [Devosia sp.]
MKQILTVAALSLLAIGAASAADLIISEPVVPITDAGFDWSGFYAGLNAGYTAGQASSVGAITGITTNVPVSGAVLGGTVGFNTQIDSFVLGLESDVAWSGATGTAVCAANPAFNCEGNLNWLGTIKGRAGMAFDNVLLFASAGLAAGGVTANIVPAAPGLTNTYSGTMTGWTVGGGVEAAVTDAMSVKAEYQYVSMGGVQAPIGTLSSTQASNLSSINHVVKVGVNFHF